jgi:O-antigen/teichoic acid export membrane protein
VNVEGGEHRRLRESRAMRASIMGVAFQGVYALAQFVVLALMTRYVDPERVGMWLTVSSLAAWMGVLSIGLQYVLLTTLGRKALTDPAAARTTLSTATVAVATIGVTVAVLVAIAGPRLPWAMWLNVRQAAAVHDAAPLGTAVLLVTALSLPALLAGHALQATQRGDLNHICSLLMQVAMVALVFLGVRAHWPLFALGGIVAGAPLLTGICHWVIGLSKRILPRISLAAFDGRLLRELLGAGALFLLLDLLTVALLQSGPMVLTHARDPQAVVPYAAASRLAGLPISAFMMIGYAYWPAYSEAWQRRDFSWISQGVARALRKIVALWLLAATAILVAGRPFVAWWLGAAVQPRFSLLVAAAGFALAYGIYAAFAAPLSGMGRLRDQLIAATAMIAVFLGAGLGLSAKFGPTGLLSGQALGATVGAVLNAYFLRRRLVDLTGGTIAV